MYINQYIAAGFNPGYERSSEGMFTQTVEDAEDGFVDAKERLLDVNNWHKYVDTAGIGFQLADGHNRLVKRRAHKGDHIKINVQGKKECCVVIEALEYDDYPDLSMETFTMRIRPCIHSMLAFEEDHDLTGVDAGLIIERRGRHLDTAFQSRNAFAGLGELVGLLNNWFALTEAQWNGMLKNFIA